MWFLVTYLLSLYDYDDNERNAEVYQTATEYNKGSKKCPNSFLEDK